MSSEDIVYTSRLGIFGIFSRLYIKRYANESDNENDSDLVESNSLDE